MFQMKIESNRIKKSQPLRLFSKLKEKAQEGVQVGNIHGVPVIQSDCSDDEESHYSHLQAIKTKIQKFKENKAMEVVRIHKMTKKTIQQIVHMLKDEFSYEAMCIIDPKYKRRSTQKKTKQLQEGGSTLPSSQQRNQQIQTPGFDFQATSGKPTGAGIDIDLRQFTLGQKETPQSQQALRIPREDDNFITQFQANTRKSTKNIKNRIMMKKAIAEFT